jgi:hypothetical protein
MKRPRSHYAEGELTGAGRRGPARNPLGHATRWRRRPGAPAHEVRLFNACIKAKQLLQIGEAER